ncbi:hypothetical protein CR513_25521, partial [Mucuna pruriens]
MAYLKFSPAPPHANLTLGFSSSPHFLSISPLKFSSTSSTLRCKGFRRLQVNQRLLTIFATNPNSVGEKSPKEGSDVNGTTNAAGGPPLLTILAGFFVFLVICWSIWSIIMWLIDNHYMPLINEIKHKILFSSQLIYYPHGGIFGFPMCIIERKYEDGGRARSYVQNLGAIIKDEKVAAIEEEIHDTEVLTNIATQVSDSYRSITMYNIAMVANLSQNSYSFKVGVAQTLSEGAIVHE